MSFPRKWESRTNRNYWTPAFAGVTNWELLEVPLNLILNYYLDNVVLLYINYLIYDII
jgi:hypothetical protein